MFRSRRLSLLSSALMFATFLAAASAMAQDSAIVSTMRNVSAVTESRGFYLTPAADRSGSTAGSLAPIQAFEIIRPGMNAVTIGRLYTSCTCVQVSSYKRAYGRGERAVLELKNVHPTPPSGQLYAIYVQITSPIRVTLRYDTFVQSSQFVAAAEPKVEEAAPAEVAAADKAESVLDKAAEEAEKEAEAAAKVVEPAADGAAEDVKEAKEAVTEAADAAVDEAKEAVNDAAKEVSAVAEALKEDTLKEDAADGDKKAAEDAGPAKREIEQRVSMITLGVSDLTRSRKFYESLGWEPVSKNKYDGVVFFQLNGMVLSLYPSTELLRDQNQEGKDVVPGGITLGINVRGKEDVEKTYKAFVDAGGKSLKAPEEMPWGSVTSYVADPDGHPWEISWVPQMPVDADGQLWINK